MQVLIYFFLFVSCASDISTPSSSTEADTEARAAGTAEAEEPPINQAEEKEEALLDDFEYPAMEYVLLVACRNHDTRFYGLGMSREDHRGPNRQTGIAHDGRIGIHFSIPVEPGVHAFASAGELVAKVASELFPHLKVFSPKRKLGRVIVLGGGSKIGESMLQDLLKSLELELRKSPYPAANMAAATKILTAEEEAYYGFLAANYLSKALDGHSLKLESEHAVGVIDLGFESLRIGLPPPHQASIIYEKNGTRTDVRRRLHHDHKSSKDVTLRTYVECGRDSAYKKVKAVDTAGVCEFHPDKADGEKCIDLISESVFTPSPFSDFKIPAETPFAALGELPAIVSFAKFFLQSRMDESDHYVTTEWPMIAWGNLRQGAGNMCTAEDKFKFKLDRLHPEGHPRTHASEIPLRCFDLCYTAALIRALGFDRTSRQVHYDYVVDGHRVDWSFGYFIHDFHARDVYGMEQKAKARRLGLEHSEL